MAETTETAQLSTQANPFDASVATDAAKPKDRKGELDALFNELMMAPDAMSLQMVQGKLLDLGMMGMELQGWLDGRLNEVITADASKTQQAQRAAEIITEADKQNIVAAASTTVTTEPKAHEGQEALVKASHMGEEGAHSHADHAHHQHKQHGSHEAEQTHVVDTATLGALPVVGPQTEQVVAGMQNRGKSQGRG